MPYINFFHFEVRVASGDCRVVIFARIRIDNLPVHLGYNSTSNVSRVNLQLLNSYKDVNVNVKERADFGVSKHLDSHSNFHRNTTE